jgi:hypothetical protein
MHGLTGSARSACSQTPFMAKVLRVEVMRRERSQRPSNCTRIYVGNLNRNTTETDLRAFFADCGNMRHVNVAWDVGRNRSAGCVGRTTRLHHRIAPSIGGSGRVRSAGTATFRSTQLSPRTARWRPRASSCFKAATSVLSTPARPKSALRSSCLRHNVARANDCYCSLPQRGRRSGAACRAGI